MSIVKALKAFFKKLTGEDVNGASIADVIMNAVPEVNSQGGGPGPGYTITKVEFEENGSVVTANMTVVEALVAMTTGPVFATFKLTGGQDPVTFCLGSPVALGSGDGLVFVGCGRDPGGEGQGDTFSFEPIVIGTTSDGWDLLG